MSVMHTALFGVHTHIVSTNILLCASDIEVHSASMMLVCIHTIDTTVYAHRIVRNAAGNSLCIQP